MDKSHVEVGDRAGVIGNKPPRGDWMANEVIRGLPAQRGGGTQGRLSEEGARSQATGPAASQFFGNGWLDGVAFRQNESIFL